MPSFPSNDPGSGAILGRVGEWLRETFASFEPVGNIPSTLKIYRRIAFGGGPPTSGEWVGGDIIFNWNPSSGSAPLFWVCRGGGTPGSWSEGIPVNVMKNANVWTAEQAMPSVLLGTGGNDTGVLFVENGSLKFQGSSGTITTIADA